MIQMGREKQKPRKYTETSISVSKQSTLKIAKRRLKLFLDIFRKLNVEIKDKEIEKGIRKLKKYKHPTERLHNSRVDEI